MIMNKKNKIKYYTYQLNMPLLNILALLLFIVVATFVYFIEYHDTYLINSNIITLIIEMISCLIIHELLHGLGFLLFKTVKKENITFGMFLEHGVFYCMCKQKIDKKIIVTSLCFPITIIGIIPLIIGMILNSYELVFLSILNITSAIGDIMMIIYFLKSPKDIIYLDLDDCTSFTVLSQEDLSNLKVPGILLKKVGEYNEKTMHSVDKRKLVISKYSYLLLFVFFILIIINIIGGIL